MKMQKRQKWINAMKSISIVKWILTPSKKWCLLSFWLAVKPSASQNKAALINWTQLTAVTEPINSTLFC